MPALIDNYIPVEMPPTSSFTVQPVPRTELLAFSTVFDLPGESFYALNERALRLLEEFKTLPDNWDEEGALAPAQNAVLLAENLVRLLQQTGQKVYHVAPGPNGEIMVDMRENGKSVEILFYADNMRYVLFPLDGNPEQGEYQRSILPKILKWLHV